MAEITVPEAQKRYTDEQVLDVREDFEVSQGMIPTALHIPMGQLGARLDELDKNQPVIIICRSGTRRTMVADALSQAGFSADTMAGGMIEWRQACLPTG